MCLGNITLFNLARWTCAASPDCQQATTTKSDGGSGLTLNTFKVFSVRFASLPVTPGPTAQEGGDVCRELKHFSVEHSRYISAARCILLNSLL